MSHTGRDIVSEFEYDGIREYENPCPGWWNWLFFGTFVFSVLYFIFFQFSPASWTIWQAYDGAVADNLRLQFAEIGELQPDQPTLLKYMHNEEWLKVGRIVFTTNCQSCHAADGQGQVGPNLTDDQWKNVKVLTDIPKVVAEGANNGAMPAWKTRLHPNEVVLVSAYVASLRGKNLTGPRGPEGDSIPPWPAAPAEK
jgi:cytochrome c oxidase cbb3-type subunit III